MNFEEASKMVDKIVVLYKKGMKAIEELIVYAIDQNWISAEKAKSMNLEEKIEFISQNFI